MDSYLMHNTRCKISRRLGECTHCTLVLLVEGGTMGSYVFLYVRSEALFSLVLRMEGFVFYCTLQHMICSVRLATLRSFCTCVAGYVYALVYIFERTVTELLTVWTL